MSRIHYVTAAATLAIAGALFTTHGFAQQPAAPALIRDVTNLLAVPPSNDCEHERCAWLFCEIDQGQLQWQGLGQGRTNDPIRRHLSTFRKSLQKCRLANALPEPDFRYRSNRAAWDSSGNSSDTMTDHGRWFLV